MLQFDVLTIFPQLIEQAISYALLGRALKKNLLAVHAHDLRNYTETKYRHVDDIPFGGGPGMILQAPPIVKGLEDVQQATGHVRRILLSPRGEVFTQEKAVKYATLDQVILICGRYEGVDERVHAFIDEELSIGDYVLAGGEFAALVVIDAVARLIPGVLGESCSLLEESHGLNGLEYPQYTRPASFRGLEVPEVLRSGHHEEIDKWRRQKAAELTRQRRPDLIKAGSSKDTTSKKGG